MFTGDTVLHWHCITLYCTDTSARRKVEYDMRTRRVLSSSGWARMWVNLVSSAVMQPMMEPTRKLAAKMPRKSRMALTTCIQP